MKRRQPKAPAPNETKRCAIYTRKSTSMGLEQEFNSLEAQREACAAYIQRTRPVKDVLRDLVELSGMGHPWTHVQTSRQAAVGSHRRAVRAEWADAEAVRPAARAAAEYRAVVALPEKAPGEQEL